MIILIYTGIILLCYGVYNFLSYNSVYPTAAVSRDMKKWKKIGGNVFIIELSRRIVKKWDLEWKGNDILSKALGQNKIFYSMTVYCVSLILTALCGLFLCLPLLFWNRFWFILLLVAVLLYVSLDPLLLLYRYRKSLDTAEKTDSKQKNSVVNMKKLVRLLLGAFSLCQILLIFVMLT